MVYIIPRSQDEFTLELKLDSNVSRNYYLQKFRIIRLITHITDLLSSGGYCSNMNWVKPLLYSCFVCLPALRGRKLIKYK